MGALNPDSLKTSQKKRALRAINLIKKTDLKNKREEVRRWKNPEILQNQRRRILADHLPGRFFTSLIIDAREGRDVAIYDVPGAYLNADIPEYKVILLNIEG